MKPIKEVDYWFIIGLISGTGLGIGIGSLISKAIC